MATLTTAFPAAQQYFGIGREAVPGTPVLPVTTTPIEKGEPDDRVTYLQDKAIRGSMIEVYGDIAGTEIADFNITGPVFLDTMGYYLDNNFGDLSTTGSSPTNSTTLSAQTAIGATTCTVAVGTGYAIGQAVQIGSGATAEVVVLTNVAGTTLTFANTPLRFTHASAQTVATVVAPFTHKFNVLNLPGGQPPVHTVTHYQGITATVKARAYSYWCSPGIDFTMSPEQLFVHDTKGTSFLGAPAASTPANSLSSVTPQPSWLFQVGVGGPASGGTLVANIQDAGVSIGRNVKAYFMLDGSQAPSIIARGTLGATGKFTYFAQDETPLLNMLNNTQPQLQLVMTNGLSGANLLSCTFDVQKGAYEVAKIQDNEHITYDVTWRAIGNSTNVGGSAGQGVITVTLVNAIPTY